MKGSQRVFNLWCSTEDEYQAWKNKLNASIISSLGFQQQLKMENYEKDLEKNIDFWRFLRIGEAEL